MIAGLGVFGGLSSLGAMLSSRIGDPIPLIVLAVAGAYGGWLVGVLVFGAVRGRDDQTSP